MSASSNKTTAQTVITLILPDTDAIPRQGSILAKYESGAGKQSLAHLMPFSYSSLADIARAVAAAQQQLESLQANPPQITVPTPTAPERPTSSPKAVKSKAPKPKKKKPSLDDFPEDDADDADATAVAPDSVQSKGLTVESELADTAAAALEGAGAVSPVQAQVSHKPATGLQVGDSVPIPDGTVDVDGDAVPFSTGKVVEIDLSATPRVWVESADGAEDVWLPLDALTNRTTPADDLSAFEQPIGMGIPNQEGQLTLFG